MRKIKSRLHAILLFTGLMDYGVALLYGLLLMMASVASAAGNAEYLLGAGDVVRVTVHQNPDLTTEARISENGVISFPLIGSVNLGGLSVTAAEQRIASQLRDGRFVLQPQVTLLPLQMRSNLVTVLGNVNHPGRYPLDSAGLRLSDMLAMAGGVMPTGADIVTLQRTVDGKRQTRQVDIPRMFRPDGEGDEVLMNNDTIFVGPAPTFYIYGEVQKPGAFKLERQMSVMQGLATGGGVTLRGTVRGLVVHRRSADGKLLVVTPGLDDILQPDDVIYVKESLF
ncbi:MAG: polysaccharide export protein EpsE [Rhodocyclales bacterium]|nr:polysaccharide export protein EpsE [Rhodocyclales bacterium]